MIDWYHARDHLAPATHELHPDCKTSRHTELNQVSDHLYAGTIPTIGASLVEAGLPYKPHYYPSDLHTECWFSPPGFTFRLRHRQK